MSASLRRLARFVGAVVFVDTLFYAVVTPLLPHYVGELGLSKAGAGVLTAAYPAGTLAASLPAGWLATRFGARVAVLLGLALLGGSSLVFGLAHVGWLLDAARFSQGVGGACSWTGGLFWLVEAAPPEQRGERLGVAFGAAVFGELLGPVAGALAGATAPAAVFSSTVLAAGALAVWALRLPRPVVRREPQARLGAALRRPDVAAGVWLVTLPSLSFGVLAVLVPLHLHDLGVGAAAIAATFLVAAGMESVLAPVTGRISDRGSRLAPVRVGLVAGAVALAVLAAVTGPAALYALVAVLVVGAFGTMWAPAMALLSEATDRAGVSQGYAAALMNLAWATGQVAGAAGGGTLAKATRDLVPLLVVAALAALTSVVARRSAAGAE